MFSTCSIVTTTSLNTGDSDRGTLIPRFNISQNDNLCKNPVAARDWPPTLGTAMLQTEAVNPPTKKGSFRLSEKGKTVIRWYRSLFSGVAGEVGRRRLVAPEEEDRVEVLATGRVDS